MSDENDGAPARDMDEAAVRNAGCRLLAYCNARARATKVRDEAVDLGVTLGSHVNDEVTLKRLLDALKAERHRRRAFGVTWDDRGRLVNDDREPRPGFLEEWNRQEAAAETGEELLEAWGGPWTEHPEAPADDWRSEVADDHTRQGYWEWVAGELERMREDEGDADDGER